MTRISRTKLVETFHGAFARNRSISEAVEAVALEVEAKVEFVEVAEMRRGPRAAPPSYQPLAPGADPDAIVARFLSYHDVTAEVVCGPSRSRWASLLRHELWWLLRRTTDLDYYETACRGGRHNHTTAMAAVKKIQGRIDRAPEYGAALLAIVADLVPAASAAVDEKAAA